MLVRSATRSRRATSTLLACVPLAMFIAASRAGAQELPSPATPSSNEIAQSREQFHVGVEAAHAERWEEARQAFERAFRILPQPIVLLNLAGAQVQTGHLIDAADNYRRFLSEATSAPAARLRPDAERWLDAALRRTPHVEVAANGLLANDTVALDDRAIGQAALESPLPVDPGAHTIVVRRGDIEVVRTTFTVRESESRRVMLRVQPPPAALPAVPARAPEVVRVQPLRPAPAEHRRAVRHARASVFASPVFWTVAGIIVAGAAAGAIVYATGIGEETGTLSPGRITVR